MRFFYNDDSVRLVGRWGTVDEKMAEASTTGAYIEFAFTGEKATARFDMNSNRQPYPRIWIQIDGGDMIESTVDAYVKVKAKNGGNHVCRIIYKGSVELFSRWFSPRAGKVSFLGYDAEGAGVLPEDNRKTIEFVGDSITEGVLVDADYFGDGKPEDKDIDQFNRVFQDDVCETYAWLTAERFGLRPIFMGYGAVGATKSGQGKVPEAAVSYPFNFDGSPIAHKNCDYILINHGANDRNKPLEVYLPKYEHLLDVIREHNPESKIICLSPFCGYAHEELGKLIDEYNAKNGCDITYVDSNGWVSPSPLHPLAAGHKIICDNLCEKIRDIIK